MSHRDAVLREKAGDGSSNFFVEVRQSDLAALIAERDGLLSQRWSNQNRAEVAERGHKAAAARDFEQRDAIKGLRARAERAEQERDEAQGGWDVFAARFQGAEARVRVLEEALRDCVQGGYMDVIGYADCSGCKAAREAAGEWWEHESIVAATHESDCPYYVYQRGRAVLGTQEP